MAGCPSHPDAARDVRDTTPIAGAPESRHGYPVAGPDSREPSAQGLFQPADNLFFVLQLIGVLLPLAQAVARTQDRIEIATVPFGLEGFTKARRLLVGYLLVRGAVEQQERWQPGMDHEVWRHFARPGIHVCGFGGYPEKGMHGFGQLGRAGTGKRYLRA